MTIHGKHKEWLSARNLDPVLAEKLGIATIQDGGANWLVVPYREGGETINHKWRMASEKRHKMDAGAPLSLWNADCLMDPKVVSGQAPVVITEGEWDALAVLQAGHPFVVSVPNGAPAQETADLDSARRYDWVDRHHKQLSEVREFVIAADDDEAGHNLRADLVALFGAERCKFIDYPMGAKDLNEVLELFGSEAVVQCITTAKPFPIQGLYSIDDFPERGKVRAYPVGVGPIDDFIKIVPGTLTVITGFANMGKSTLMNVIIGNALRNLFPVCVASFETDVKPILVNGLKQAMIGTNQNDLARHPDNRTAQECLRERLKIISQSVDEELEMDLDKFLDLCRIAVRRHGVKMIVLDPWNEMEHKRRRDESETDYIGRAIRAIKRFAKQNDVAFFIVAHPTKPQEASKRPPGLYDISGSSNWANKADYGLTYHRPDVTVNYAEIIISKVRMGLPGMRGKVGVCYDFQTSHFVNAG